MSMLVIDTDGDFFFDGNIHYEDGMEMVAGRKAIFRGDEYYDLGYNYPTIWILHMEPE